MTSCTLMLAVGFSFSRKVRSKESLGSHGLFKAKFSKAISQADTVFLPLYKRVFAKFPEEDRVEVF